jgi:16S rRNA (guanine966-N2)-methyltransferase
MRIVAGAWAGQPLVSPGGRVRPTSEEVRAALMDLLGSLLTGASVADLFAGTGALGLEALSRGARRCDFVENGPAALHALKANVAAFPVRTRTRIFVRDAIPFAAALGPGAYDVVFADPPYGSRKLDRIVEQWLRVPFSAVLALEHSPEHELPAGGRRRRIGDTAVTVLRRPPQGRG